MSPKKTPARSRAATPKAAPPAKKKLSLVAQVRQQDKLLRSMVQGVADMLARIGALELANSNRLAREKRELEEVVRILHGGSLGVRVEGRPDTAAELAAGAAAAVNFSAGSSHSRSSSSSQRNSFNFANIPASAESDEASRSATLDLLTTGTGALHIGPDGRVRHVPHSELFKPLPWWRRAWLAICDLFASPKDVR